MFEFTVIAAVLSIATAINVIAMVISWNRAKTKFGLYFAIGLTSNALWTLASALDYAAVPIPLKVFFAKWEYLFYNTASAFFLLFLLSYAGYVELAGSKFLRAALWIGCGTNILLAWTNDWHGWLWSGFSLGEFGNNTVIFEHGPAFLWVAGSGYLLYLSIVLTAWLASRRGSTYSRHQGQVLFYAFLLPLLGNLMYQFEPFGLKGMDWSSVFTTGSVILCLWALYGTKLLDLIPIAREKLIDCLSDGMIVLDMQNRIVDINQPAIQMIGDSENLLGRNIGGILRSAQSLVEHLPEKEIRTELEVGERKKRYFDVLVSPLIENQNAIVGRLIIFRDITERKRSDTIINARERISEFAARHNHAELLQNALDELCDLTDSPIGFFHFVEPDQSSLSLQAWSTRTLAEFCKAEGSRRHYDINLAGVWVDCIRQGEPVIHNDYASLPHRRGLPEGHAAVIREMVFPITREGKIVAIIGVGNKADEYTQADVSYASRLADMIWDITERKRMEAELERLATTDALTGLLNRRELIRRAEMELERARRYQHLTSAIMLDVDHFKKINDIYGHPAGDRVLVSLAKLLTREIRACDLAARYGGEEFMLILPETNIEKAQGTAERIRHMVADTPLPVDGKSIRLTISLGVVSSEGSGQDFESLLKDADRLLYKAKQSGRNRVVSHV